MLSGLCEERGWSLDVIESYRLNGGIVSSTTVREAVLRGQVESACEMLGYPFIIQSKVIKGDGRGRVLGFPTANLSLRPNKIYPARGSYSGFTYITAIGIPLHWKSDTTRLSKRQAFTAKLISGFEGDLYEKTIIFTSYPETGKKLNLSVRMPCPPLKKDIKHAKQGGRVHTDNAAMLILCRIDS